MEVRGTPPKSPNRTKSPHCQGLKNGVGSGCQTTVSKGWAKPLLWAGCQKPEQLSQTSLGPRLLQGPGRGELCSSPHPGINSKMRCPLSNRGCLTLERTGLPASHIPTLNQIIQWDALGETENGISQSGCCEAGLCSHLSQP